MVNNVRVRPSRVPRDCGATAVEYALLLAGIAAVIISVVALLGDTVAGLFAITW